MYGVVSTVSELTRSLTATAHWRGFRFVFRSLSVSRFDIRHPVPDPHPVIESSFQINSARTRQGRSSDPHTFSFEDVYAVTGVGLGAGTPDRGAGDWELEMVNRYQPRDA